MNSRMSKDVGRKRICETAILAGCALERYLKEIRQLAYSGRLKKQDSPLLYSENPIFVPQEGLAVFSVPAGSHIVKF